MSKISIKVPHVVSVVAMAFLGAFVSYFSQKDPGTVISALSHWSTAEPMLLSALTAAAMTIYPLLQHSILVPSDPAQPLGPTVSGVILPPGPPASPPRSLMALPAAAWIASMALLGCGASVKQVINSAGEVCQVVVTATDPALAPLCTTAEALAQAIAALTTSGADAGVGAVEPTRDQIYAWLLTHGASVGH